MLQRLEGQQKNIRTAEYSRRCERRWYVPLCGGCLNAVWVWARRFWVDHSPYRSTPTIHIAACVQGALQDLQEQREKLVSAEPTSG